MSEGFRGNHAAQQRPAWGILIGYLLVALLMCWPAWLNGQAFFLQDTTAYIKGAASGVALIAHSSTAETWLHAGQPVEGEQVTAPAEGSHSGLNEYSSSPDKKGVLAGRSLYYGMYLFLMTALCGLNLVPIVTAIMAVITIVSVSLSLGLSHGRTMLLLAVLAIASPLPFFSSMLMPDIFAGLAILAVSAFLFVHPARKLYRYWWALIILCAVLFHTANILIISGLLMITLGMTIFLKTDKSTLIRRAVLVFGIVLIGIAGEVFFNAAVKYFTHNAPIRPPFISARLVADGPGTKYASNFCATSPFEICRYQAVLGKGSSDDFLWSLDPKIGVFTLASKSSRELLSRQDSAFAMAVFKQYPFAVMQTTAKNFFSQLTMLGLEEFNYPVVMVNEFSEKIPAQDFEQLQHSKASNAVFPSKLSEGLILAGVLLATLICAWRAPAYSRHHPMFWVTMGVLAGMLINAFVCGALSTPHDRYQARIIWLLPLLAFYLYSLRPLKTGKA